MPVDAAAFEEGDERFSIENEIISFLHENRKRAYNVQEITEEVMDAGRSESNVSSDNSEEFAGWFLDLATVNSILDALVDTGRAQRRVLDTGQGMRSYYRAP